MKTDFFQQYSDTVLKMHKYFVDLKGPIEIIGTTVLGTDDKRKHRNFFHILRDASMQQRFDKQSWHTMVEHKMTITITAVSEIL